MTPDQYDKEVYLPPQNQDAEEAVLGTMLIDPDAVARIREVLNPDSFYREVNRWIYLAILELDDQRKPIDLLTLSDRLRAKGQLEDIGGEAYLIGLINIVPTSVNDVHYAMIVEETGERRRMIRSANHIMALAHDETEPLADVVDKAMEEALTFGTSIYKPTTVHISKSAKDLMQTIEERSQIGSEVTGIPTGFTDIDRATAGLQRGELSILAARPGMGKTAWQSTVAMLAATKYKFNVGVFSLEMSGQHWALRIASSMSNIVSDQMRRGRLREDQWPVFYDACGRLSEASLWIDDTPLLTPAQLRAKVRRLYQEFGIDLIMVDYLQLMATTKNFHNKVQEVGYITKQLKAIAKEMDIHVNCSSQLSRAVEQRQDKRPQLSDLRDSGNIEEDADVVMFIYRDEYYNPDSSERPNIAEVNIAKNRNGNTKICDLYWNGPMTRFNNLQRQEIHL